MTFWLLCCLDVFLIDLLLIFDGFWRRKSIKNRSKIDPKGDRKQDASWDGFWLALGPIWDGFWLQVGAKLGSSWHQNLKNGGPKTMSKKELKNKSAGSAS